jgi:hypothetical protein
MRKCVQNLPSGQRKPTQIINPKTTRDDKKMKKQRKNRTTKPDYTKLLILLIPMIKLQNDESFARQAIWLE